MRYGQSIGVEAGDWIPAVPGVGVSASLPSLVAGSVGASRQATEADDALARAGGSRLAGPVGRN